jgi:DNA-binding MarR family transcriptional regulator
MTAPPRKKDGAAHARATGATAGTVPGDVQAVALSDVIARLRRAMRRAARAADPGGVLSVAQLELLSCLAEAPGARPGQVARLLHLAPTSVTTLVNGLESRKLIRRSAADDDRRGVSLSLTVAGAAAVRRWQAVNNEILSAAVERLHPAWRHALGAAVPALSELVATIDELAGPRP